MRAPKNRGKGFAALPAVKKTRGLTYRQVDVFANEVLNGNGVAVFWDSRETTAEAMQELTRELRQFEAIFLTASNARNEYRARVFTMEEELDFAGHPVLGAAAVLHEKYGQKVSETWRIVLNAGTIEVSTRRIGKSYVATMNQPEARFFCVNTAAVRDCDNHARGQPQCGCQAPDAAPGSRIDRPCIPDRARHAGPGKSTDCRGQHGGHAR